MRCKACNGSGYILCRECAGEGVGMGHGKCPACEGRGNAACQTCGGSGKVGFFSNLFRKKGAT